jgi:hypothetical protein
MPRQFWGFGVQLSRQKNATAMPQRGRCIDLTPHPFQVSWMAVSGSLSILDSSLVHQGRGYNESNTVNGC